MKTDLDTLMESAGASALLVTGPGQHNPAMVYLTGGGHLTHADLIKPRGQPAVLFHGPMEREEAARTGLATRSYSEFPMAALLKEAGGSRQKALALRYQQMLSSLGVTSGKILLYGRDEVGGALNIFTALQAAFPEFSIAGDAEDTLLPEAMATKSPDEIARIRRMGSITTAVVAQTADFLSAHASRNGVLVKSDGQPLRIGEVKAQINRWLAERGAENPEGTIFAAGHDAGVPHSSGNPDGVLRLGETIVFDIFPCEAEGGYYYDFTRTWCLGYAPDPALALYETVLDVYRQIFSELAADAYFPSYQRRAVGLFEARGHPTIQGQPDTLVGYVHSLGHGIGLKVHEKPWSGSQATASDTLRRGSVFTIEPGLYYPDRGLGVRLEDSAWVTPEGGIEVLAPSPLDLILPISRQL